MLGRARAVLREPLAGRRLVTPLAALFFVAALADPGRWWEAAVLAVPVTLFALWSVRPSVMPVLAVATPLAVAVAIWHSALEPSLFLISLLALTVAAWDPSPVRAAVVVAVCLLTPVVVDLASPDANVAWAIWMLGILFPAALGVTIRRLEQVTAELARVRQELADRAVLDERQRIGRDVHDLVGHGLAAVMLQVTGARHVLRRDVDAADEALRSAEEVGRASMQELRRTVEALRREDAPDAPAPGLAQVRDLVATYRSAGLPVRLEAAGDLAAPAAVGLTTYRITQQALANAAQHAPEARTTVSVEVSDAAVRLAVESVGALREGPSGGGHGLVSMRERARVAGGRLHAGRTGTGWAVRCVLPLDPAAEGATAGQDAWLHGTRPVTGAGEEVVSP